MLKTLLKKLNLLLDLMLKEQEEKKKEREEKRQMEQDKELREYTIKHMRKDPGQIVSNINDPDRPVNIKRSDIAVPYNLTNDEKMILEDFYNK
jgi:ABC-type lipopolysaccharide export system ATPase subunit